MKTGTQVVEVNVQIAPVTVWAEDGGSAFVHAFPLHGRADRLKSGDWELQTPEEVMTAVITCKSNGMVRFPDPDGGCIYIDRRRILRIELGKVEPHWVRRTADLDAQFVDDDGDPLTEKHLKVISRTEDPPKPSFWSRFAFWRVKS